MNMTACAYCDYLECRCDGLENAADLEEHHDELEFASLHEEGLA
jgi:hypothetical protein